VKPFGDALFDPVRLQKATRPAPDAPSSYVEGIPVERLRGLRHVDGHAESGAPPALVFQPPRHAKASSKFELPLFIPYGWDGTFGSSLTISMLGTKGNARVCLPPGHPVLRDLRGGEFVAVILDGDGAVENAYVVSYRAMGLLPSLLDHLDRVETFAPLLRDDRAHFWETLDRIQFLHEWLTPKDWLSVGWSRDYSVWVNRLDAALHEARGVGPLRQDGLTAPPDLDAFIDVVSLDPPSVPRVLETLEAILADPKAFHRFLNSEQAFLDYGHASSDHTYCNIMPIALDVLMRTTRQTSEGRRITWWGHERVQYLDVLPREFPTWFDPVDFWSCQAEALPVNLGATVSGCDVPLDLRFESPTWTTMPVAEDLVEVNSSADALLDEATAHKKWSIPPGAILQIPVGPFLTFQCWEVDHEVFFVARSPRGEYALLFMNTRDRRLHFGARRLLQDFPRAELIEAAFKLLLAAAIRDFFVVEQRERVFEARTVKSLPGIPQRKEGPIVIYLPRVKYTATADVKRCTSDLGQTDRRAHFVRAHLRRAASADEHQLILAARYGFTVPQGYTFVRPHERGHVQRETIYRSRSALRSLYQEVVFDEAKARPDGWFQFERDVRDVLRSLGFEVEHVAASRRGDQGVDVYATKGTDLDEVNWIAQCKCFGPKRKVGPSTIRDLLGALGNYPAGTRGMVVTTSTFTSGAVELASREGLRLIDGEEFQRLLADMQRQRRN
jgi:hypothetical protein